MIGSLRIVRVDRYLNPETHGCLERSVLVCCFHFLCYFFCFGGDIRYFSGLRKDVLVSEVLNKHEDLRSVSNSKRKKKWMDGWMNKLVKARQWSAPETPALS